MRKREIKKVEKKKGAEKPRARTNVEKPQIERRITSSTTQGRYIAEKLTLKLRGEA